MRRQSTATNVNRLLSASLNCDALYSNLRHSILIYSIVLYSTLLHSTLLYSEGGHTGWSSTWEACLLARLRDSEGSMRAIGR